MQIGDRVVELVQDLGDARDGFLGEDLVGVGGRELALQGMPGRDRRRPVEHLLPVGLVARRRGLDEESGVPGLPVGTWRDETLLGVLGLREELAEHAVRGVEHVLGHVVTREHEARGEAARYSVDDRAPLGGGAILEREQVDIEDLTHARTLPPPSCLLQMKRQAE